MPAKKATKRRNGRKEYQVFVSHASADKWLARTICKKLDEIGVRTFRDDRDINGGDDIPDSLRREIIRSKELLVLVTPESADRPWVLLEVGGAWLRGMRITAVLCHVSVDRIPDLIKSKKAVAMNEFDAYVDSLRQRILNR
jgi:hypothetical protein